MRCDFVASRVEIDLYGRPTLLLHGDTLCTEDTDCLKRRAESRSPLWQQAVLSLSLADRRALADSLRNESKMAGSNKSMKIMDMTSAEVLKVMAEAGVDLMIHGHTYRPARHPLIVNDKPAERIVLGDWSTQQGGWYIRAERNGSIDLIQFPLARLNNAVQHLEHPTK